MLRDIFEFLLTGVFGFGSAILLLLAIVVGIDTWTCAGYAEITGRKTKMQSGVCYVQSGNQWYSRKEHEVLVGGKAVNN